MMYAVINTKSGAIYYLSSNIKSCSAMVVDLNALYEDNCVEAIRVPMLMLDDWGIQLLKEVNKYND